MTDDRITTDLQLDEQARSIARDILEDIKQFGGDAYDLAHVYADGCQYVIYYHHAHSICQNCNTEVGEACLEDFGVGQNPTYDSLAVLIAYNELHSRILAELEKLGAE
jgi:predicted amidophosphoribosyltransferase